MKTPVAFADWLHRFLPGIPDDASAGWLEPAVVNDPTDGKLVHLDGLNLSRAWMLDGIVAGLPAGDGRRPALLAAAAAHRASGLASVTGATYEGGHWLGTFAAYLLTGRGLAPPAVRPSAGASNVGRPDSVAVPERGLHLAARLPRCDRRHPTDGEYWVACSSIQRP